MATKKTTKKRAVKKKVTNPKVPRTRNGGTMTESAFWSSIRSALRQKSRWWVPIKLVKENAKRAYKGPNKLQKWEYQCAKCKEWFKDKEIAVDHVVECGELRCAADVPGFIERLFLEDLNGYQCLCKACHNEKTQTYLKDKKKK